MSKSFKSDWDQLISDYNKDNAYIKKQKRQWLPVRTNLMGKNPMNDSDADDANAPEGKAILPKKKTGSKPSNKPASPVMQVMKAVAKAAQAPGKKKKNPIQSGPSKSNVKKPQKAGRVDKSDGPSAEGDGEA